MNKQSRILLVEDEALSRVVTQEILEHSGYQVTTAEDGLSAWKKIDKRPHQFDLLLVDKNMPQLDGISLLKQMKADTRFKDLPVIILTGSTRQQDIVDGFAAGAYSYLLKPASADVLRIVIQNALAEGRQKHELRALIRRQTNNMRLLRKADFCFKTLQEAKDLAVFLAEASMDPERTITGFAELLINAVEHGNLGITYAEKGQLMRSNQWLNVIEERLKLSPFSERVGTVSVDKTAGECTVMITDEGAGFDWRDYVDFSPERAFDPHGRGIAMAKAICFDSLNYLGTGNTVIVSVKL